MSYHARLQKFLGPRNRHIEPEIPVIFFVTITLIILNIYPEYKWSNLRRHARTNGETSRAPAWTNQRTHGEGKRAVGTTVKDGKCIFGGSGQGAMIKTRKSGRNNEETRRRVRSESLWQYRQERDLGWVTFSPHTRVICTKVYIMISCHIFRHFATIFVVWLTIGIHTVLGIVGFVGVRSHSSSSSWILAKSPWTIAESGPTHHKAICNPFLAYSKAFGLSRLYAYPVAAQWY